MSKSKSKRRLEWSNWITAITEPKTAVGEEIYNAWAEWISDIIQERKTDKVRTVISGFAPLPVADWVQTAQKLAFLVKEKSQEIVEFDDLGDKLSNLEKFIRNKGKSP